MARLQVALDLTDVGRALEVASRVVSACERSRLLLEAGTPLIKSCGIEAVRKLSSEFPDIPVVADMKIADVGALEAEMAISSGAAYVTVLACASDETVAAAVDAAHALGGKVVADLMPTAGDPLLRAQRLLRLNVDALCYHVPIDVQRLGARQVGSAVLRALKALGASEVAAAGGITPETAKVLAAWGADILVVGRFIHSAADPGEAARRILLELG